MSVAKLATVPAYPQNETLQVMRFQDCSTAIAGLSALTVSVGRQDKSVAKLHRLGCAKFNFLIKAKQWFLFRYLFSRDARRVASPATGQKGGQEAQQANLTHKTGIKNKKRKKNKHNIHKKQESSQPLAMRYRVREYPAKSAVLGLIIIKLEVEVSLLRNKQSSWVIVSVFIFLI